MERYRNNLQDQFGNEINGATIEVRDVVGGALSSIYSDDGVTVLANPFTAQNGSEFFFYASTGRYDITISGPVSDSIPDVLLYDPATGGSGAVANGTVDTAALSWNAAGPAWAERTNVLIDSNGVRIDDGVLRIDERAADIADVAGVGQLWVINSTPNALRFTDDAGNIYEVLASLYFGAQQNLRAADESASDITSGAEVRLNDDSFYGVGLNELPRANISGGNVTIGQEHIGKQFFYNEATARSLLFPNDAAIKVDSYFSLRVGPSGGTLTGDGQTGVTITYWDGTGYTTTAAAGNVTIGEGQYTIWKNTDTNWFLDGPNIS